jgi:NDP-sugar pyrophosphorylase family protein
MVVYKNNGKFGRSNVILERDRVKLYNRADAAPPRNFIHAGLSVLDKSVLKLIPAGRNSPQDLMWEKLIKRGQLHGYSMRRRFYEIGSFKGLDEFKRLVQRGGHRP